MDAELVPKGLMENTDHCVLIPRPELRDPGGELRSCAYVFELGSGTGSERKVIDALPTVHMLKQRNRQGSCNLAILFGMCTE